MMILAPVDRSDRAKKVVAEAETLAEAFDDTVHVLHVLSRSNFVDLERTSVNDTGETVSLDRIKETAAEVAAEAVESNEVSVETVGEIGDASTKIIEYAEEHDARYIVVGPRKRSPTGKAIFGSVAQSILLNSSCPVVSTVN